MKPKFVLPPKIQEKLDVVKTKFSALPKNTQKMSLVALVLFAIIFILILLAALFAPQKNHTPTLTPSPTPVSVNPVPNVILNASRYAIDSGVLQIESDLNGIQKQLDSTDVTQRELIQPNIDFNINFNK